MGWNIHNAVLAGIVAFILEFAILAGLAYGSLRFATKFLQMRRDIEEIKIALRDMKPRI